MGQPGESQDTESGSRKLADSEPRDQLRWALIAWAVVAIGAVAWVLPRGPETRDAVVPTETRVSVSGLVNLGNLAMEKRASDPAALEQALDHFRRGHELDPNHLNARFGLAWARQVKGLPESEWRGLYERTVSDTSILAYLSLFNLAVAEREAGRHSEAIAFLEHALRVMPERADGWLALGTNQVATEDNARAVLGFQRAAELTPDSSRAFFLLGRAHHALGRDVEAEIAWSRAVRLGPVWADQIEAARVP